MGWALVAGSPKSSASGNSAAARALITQSPVAGDLLVLAVSTFHVVSVSVTDSQGNAWAQVGSYSTNGSVDVSIWIAIANSSGANTVTITPNASAYMGLCYAEFSFTAAFTAAVDGSVSNSGESNGVITSSSGSIPVNAGNELALAAYGQGTSTVAWTPGSGFTNAASQTNGSSAEACYLDFALNVSSAITDNGVFASSVAWASIAGSIQATASGGGSSGPWPWFFDGLQGGRTGMNGGMGG